MSGTDQPKQPLRRRGQALVDAIHEAVVDEVLEHGVGGLSIERVAERARTGKASIYRRWPTRTDLLTATFERFLPLPAEPPDTGSLRGDLVAALGELAAWMNTKRSGAMRQCMSELEREPEIASLIRERLVPARRRLLVEILRRGAARGEVRPDAVTDRIAEVGPTLLFGEAMSADGPLTDDTVAAVVDEVLLPLVRPGR